MLFSVVSNFPHRRGQLFLSDIAGYQQTKNPHVLRSLEERLMQGHPRLSEAPFGNPQNSVLNQENRRSGDSQAPIDAFPRFGRLARANQGPVSLLDQRRGVFLGLWWGIED